MKNCLCSCSLLRPPRWPDGKSIHLECGIPRFESQSSHTSDFKTDIIVAIGLGLGCYPARHQALSGQW